jgi:iron(III) transport system ATP-binding protein
LSEIDSMVTAGHASTPLGNVKAAGISDGTPVTVAIRPAGGAQISQQGPGTPGRVIGKRDTIGIDICEVKVEGLDAPLGIRQPADSGLSVGQDVFVTLNEEHVLVFARD